jgi:serine/threonine-protein phosphatase 2A regulatory subunit A
MEEWWPLFTALAGDAQDSVRLLAVETALAFGDALPAKTTHDLLLPVVFRLAGDRSWRVRYLVGASFTGLMERVFLSAGSTALDPLAIFTALLGDAEAEVRTAAARQLATTCAHFSQTDFERKVLPVLRTLATDPSMPVRAAVATQLNPLSAIAGAELAASALFPLYTHFFADESSQVRLNAVSKMDVVCQVMGIDKLSQSILPAIVHLAEDKQWRVREAVIEHLPTLTSHLGETFFDDNLARICLALLEDPVHQVRQSAISNVRALVDRFGMVWCGERLLQPAVSRLVANGSYLRRTGVVRLIAVLAPVADDAVFASLALPALKTLAADAVPNVRLCVARAIGDLALLVQTRASLAGMARELVPLLQKLVQDADGDVQFYATRALSVA